MLDELVDTLLYEGYALYPYTPGATKNATPTPFGIVYPPAYAAGSGATFDHLQIECLTTAPSVRGEVHFLQASGERHEGRRAGSTCRPPGVVAEFDFDGLRGTASLSLEDGRMRIRVENHTEVPAGLDRSEALLHSLLSTHVVGRVDGGRFVSPLEAKGCEQVNSWPVLATEADDAVLGAAIMLPDHPQLAPESRGSLFDSTEIEEALLIHVLALSDDEREAAASQDPAVRADARARGAHDAAGADGPARARDGGGPARGRGVGGGRRRRLPARRHGRAAAGRQRDGAGPHRGRAPRRRSSASTTTTTAPCTSRSPSTTSRART